MSSKKNKGKNKRVVNTYIPCTAWLAATLQEMQEMQVQFKCARNNKKFPIGGVINAGSENIITNKTDFIQYGKETKES